MNEPQQPFFSSTQHPVTVLPYPQESLVGYIYRLAEARRPMTPGAIAVDCGMRRPPSNRPRPGTMDKLAELAGVPLDDIEPLGWGPLNRNEVRFRGLVLPGRSIGLREQAPRRVCPGCLAERAYHRAIWDFIFTSACPIHARTLLDTCRSCGRYLWWAGSDVTHCGRCLGGNLTAFRTADVPEADLRGIRVVYGLFREPGFEADANYARTLAPFRDLGDGPIVVFLYRAGLFLLGSRYEPFSFQTPDDLYPQAHLALARGLSLAEDWPDSFEAALEAMRRCYPGMGRQQTLDRSAGAVERWLDTLPAGGGNAIRDACRAYRERVGTAT